MKRLLTIVLLCLSVGTAAYAQESAVPAFRKSFSIELSSGYAPLHSILSTPSGEVEYDLAMKGIKVDRNAFYYPLVNVSGTWWVIPRCELVLTGGACWGLHSTEQYEAFGIDPKGNPRYDLSKTPRSAGLINSPPVWSMTFQARLIWNPGNRGTVYSAAGAGVITDGTGVVPVPSLTPIAIRLCGQHFYGFMEITLGSVATFGHAGLGWKF